MKLKVAVAARDLFNFFFQLESPEPLAQKYWGALYQLLEVRSFPLPFDSGSLIGMLCRQIIKYADLRNFYSQVQDLARLAVHLCKQMHALSRQKDSTIPTAPRQCYVACLHGIMHMVHWENPKTATKHFNTARSLLLAGKIQAQNLLRAGYLQEREAALPLGMLLLVIRRLLNDVAQENFNIPNTYARYFKKLVSLFI